jgi:inner membrane protein
MPSGIANLTINGIGLIPIYNYFIEDKSGNNKHNNGIEIVTAGAAVMSTAKLPDKLEPAIHPNHRASYHSIAFAVMVGIGGYFAWKDLQETRNARIETGVKQISFREIIDIVLVGAAASYVLHLISDGFTPKGLPLL